MSGASKSIVNTPEAQFLPQSVTLKSRVVLAGNYDPAKTTIAENILQQIVSAADAATKYGLGSELHRMAIYFEKSSNKEIEFYAFPLTAPGGAAAEEFEITFATNASSAGSWYFRIGSYLNADVIQVNVSVADDPTAQAAALAAAITSNGDLPFKASSALGVCTIVAKTKSSSGGDYQITNNIGIDAIGKKESDSAPGGTTVVIASSVSGVGESSLTPLWAKLAQESTKWFTDVITPYDSAAVMDAALAVCGDPNSKTGLYGAPVYKPFNNWTAGNEAGSTGLTNAISLGDSRKEIDPCNVRCELPDSPEIGFEAASYVMGAVAKRAQENAALGYTSLSLPELYGPIDPDEDWTNESSNRDLAVDAGITPIAFLTGQGKPFDVTSFWHPTTSEVNAPFKFVVNQRKIWNVANAVKTYQNSSEIQDRPTVSSVAATEFQANAIDTDTVKSSLRLLAEQWGQKAWLYISTFTIVNLTVVEDSENSDKYIIYVPIITSGNLRQKEADVAVTRNIAAATVVIGG